MTIVTKMLKPSMPTAPRRPMLNGPGHRLGCSSVEVPQMSVPALHARPQRHDGDHRGQGHRHRVERVEAAGELAACASDAMVSRSTAPTPRMMTGSRARPRRWRRRGHGVADRNRPAPGARAGSSARCPRRSEPGRRVRRSSDVIFGAAVLVAARSRHRPAVRPSLLGDGGSVEARAPRARRARAGP